MWTVDKDGSSEFIQEINIEINRNIKYKEGFKMRMNNVEVI
jgi:hypothetical protein